MKIIITGVTRGLGKALAEWYIANGHTVIGCGRSGAAIFDLRFTHPEPHTFDAIDITDSTRVSIWAERMLGVHGTPDYILNAAGISQPSAPLWTIPAQDFSKLIDINIKGTANIIRAFAPALIEAKRGVIVNFSSDLGHSALAGQSAYCASKWAIEGLTKSLAEELPHGVAALTLKPGKVKTDTSSTWAQIDMDGALDAATWAQNAAPYILTLGSLQNGQTLNYPAS
ncbi:MAG: 3-oxoacyl-(acyl-carrier-protein) reductase FabG [Verrucomicrobia bacterium ADurb.Bin122]|jgi:NAD(P)-dependent dehydrogenase (short-subunit alcohol dehydrogenase family)|nr:MAG: 3-oxoacyl-(acyl-carrier-protein) reductase FabG [Verrucomicrobia bacterium ADurb.Bin122]HNW41411.1 SDR family NAD(P)-dependent oxidoreductase [Opitutaceae bacterium]HOD47830.1 SDR family NAD(P)-dependent oxidoreductase [Opitutaceae bacterium]HOG92012.1 SDR family NAD(P)-dependent oxidoreductase [Opitutaceae bacterium]HQL22536.1 SDR family NAD(P)-dependent oxidoreductase [Opitutaceae bacterium]